MSGTLRRYLVSRTARATTAWAIAMLALYLGVDLADRTASGAWPLAAWPLRWPTALVHTLPLAALAGATHALAVLVRAGEWDGARASGVGRGALLRAVLVVPLVVAIVVAATLEWVAPAAAARWSRVTESPLPGAPAEVGPSRWVVRGMDVVRAPPDPVVATLGRTPRIRSAHDETASAPAWPPVGALRWAELSSVARKVERAGHDAAPYRSEAAFRPVLAATAVLVPWVALPLVLVLLRRSTLLASTAAAGVAGLAYVVLVVCLHAARAGVPAAPCALGVLGTLGASGLVVRVAARRGRPRESVGKRSAVG